MARTDRRKKRSLAAAVMLSLAAHGGLVLLLFTTPPEEERRQPLALDHVALSLGNPRPRLAPTLIEGPEEEPETLVGIQVSSPPRPARSTPGPSPALSAPAQSPQLSSAGSGGSGNRGGVGLFGATRSARSVVFVLDRSLSMGLHGALDMARKELLANLHSLPAAVCFQVVTYNGRAEPLEIHGRCDLVGADAAALEQVANALARLQPSGGTDHRRALLRGLRYHPEVLYFVTDADDLSPADVRSVTESNRSGTRIHAIELRPGHTPGADSPLRHLAEANRGTYRRVSPE